jgi:hypothetical protein
LSQNYSIVGGDNGTSQYSDSWDTTADSSGEGCQDNKSGAASTYDIADFTAGSGSSIARQVPSSPACAAVPTKRPTNSNGSEPFGQIVFDFGAYAQ